MRVSAALLLILGVVASSNAQVSRWRLGGPALLIDMPGSPSVGGVAWHQSNPYNYLPTSWSASSDDATIEVSSEYGEKELTVKAGEVAKALGGTFSNSANGKISNCPSLYFNVGNRSGLVIRDSYRLWIVVGTAKTQAGAKIVNQCLSSISVERSGAQRWVRRNLGKTKMNAPLPFELSLDDRKDDPEKRTSYELFYDGLEVTSFVESAADGKVFKYENTMRDYPNGEKEIPGTENFTSKRTKVKGNGYSGDLFELQFKRGNKEYFIKTTYIGDERRISKVSVIGNPGNAKHVEQAAKIMDGLMVSDANFDGLESRQVGTEGIWIDFPKDLERDKAGGTSFRQYGYLVGNYGADVRIVDKTPGTGDNPDQLLDFMEIKFKNEAKDAKDISTDRSRTTVNGLEAKTLKMVYKRSGQETLRYGMAIFGPDKNYVIELIGYGSQKPLFERILDTVEVRIPATNGWKMTPVGESGISMLAPATIKFTKGPASEAGADSLITGLVAEGNVYGLITEVHYSGTAPSTGSQIQNMAKTLFGVMKVDYAIEEQRPFEVGGSSGIRAIAKASQGGKDLPADLIIVRRGQYLWVMLLLSNPADRQSVMNRYSIINSLI
ncbi:MAG: hypothetical protein WCI55_03910 [Armatimonadota bacterium]